MIGALLITAAMLTGDYSLGGVASAGATCGVTTVPVLELGSVVCEAPSQILAQPTLFEPQVGYGYGGVLAPWAAGYNYGLPPYGGGYGGRFGGPFGGGWGHGHGHCTTSTTGGVTTRTCT